MIRNATRSTKRVMHAIAQCIAGGTGAYRHLPSGKFNRPDPTWPGHCRQPGNRHLGCLLLLLALLIPAGTARAEAKFVQTPYEEQKVVFDFYFDDPRKLSSALYWIRSLLNPLMGEPYNYAPEFLDLIVLVHGTEIVATVKQNYKKYKDDVERMKYYAALGVKFKVCGIAAEDYGYSAQDFQDFIELVPSAITELAHWQLQGYATITPVIMDKKFSIEEIR